MSETVVVADQLTRRFGKVTAVDRLSLAVTRGEVFGLVGPDGAGKTTTLRMLCGLVDPDEGEAIVAGYKVREQLDAVRDAIGYMAQRFGLYGDLSVEENMDFYADLFGIVGEERAALKNRLLEMTRMQPFRDRPAAKLSGGMKQKLSLMCTLLHKPEILFLDEPTNGVDPVSRRDFWEILQELVRGGLTVVVTTAYLDEAERCDRVGLMDHGRFVRCDTPAALKAAIPEPCYAVRGERLREAKAALERLPEVSSVEMSGAALHLFVHPTAQLAHLQDTIAAAGFLNLQFQPILPSLEDVLIYEIRKAAA
ncbi:MAG: ABC transporter ATP-binding protein [Bryobacteraceae bacterium]|nr:ABC transporter ATP-binding protein [Bryobacteraceae bacterium]